MPIDIIIMHAHARALLHAERERERERDARARARTHTHTHSLSDAHPDIDTPRRHRRTQAQTHAHTHTHAQARTHTRYPNIDVGPHGKAPGSGCQSDLQPPKRCEPLSVPSSAVSVESHIILPVHGTPFTGRNRPPPTPPPFTLRILGYLLVYSRERAALMLSPRSKPSLPPTLIFVRCKTFLRHARAFLDLPWGLGRVQASSTRTPSFWSLCPRHCSKVGEGTNCQDWLSNQYRTVQETEGETETEAGRQAVR